MIMIGLSFIIYHLSTNPSGAQTVPYLPGVTPEGAVYYLPKTAIRVTVRVARTTYTPGDFCKYAERYLRLNNVATEPSVSHEVIYISQMPVAVPDTSKVYSVKFDPKSIAANVQLSEDGRLLAINAKNQEADMPQPFVPAPQAAPQNPRNFLSEDILSAGSTAKMAELTAQEIYDIRENRSLLVKGQADFMPKDGEQLRLMLNQLEQQDAALTSLFSGTTRCDTTEHVFMVMPDRPIDYQVLFRLSQWRGLVDADDLSGTPYFISVTDLATVPAEVNDPKSKNQDSSLNSKLQSQKSKFKGVFVNVPSRMRSIIYQGNDQVDQAEMPAPQFGHTDMLSDQLFNKRYTTQLWIDPISGAVQRLQADQPK